MTEPHSGRTFRRLVFCDGLSHAPTSTNAVGIPVDRIGDADSVERLICIKYAQGLDDTSVDLTVV